MGDAELVALAIARVLLGLPDDRFTGLPSSLVIGKRERFAVDDRIEAFVSGTAHVQMIDEQGQVFADVQLVTVIDEAWVMLELGNRAAQIVATAVEEHLDGTSCTRTISQTVTAQNRIYFPSRCYDPRYKARLGRRCLRRRQFPSAQAPLAPVGFSRGPGAGCRSRQRLRPLLRQGALPPAPRQREGLRAQALRQHRPLRLDQAPLPDPRPPPELARAPDRGGAVPLPNVRRLLRRCLSGARDSAPVAPARRPARQG